MAAAMESAETAAIALGDEADCAADDEVVLNDHDTQEQEAYQKFIREQAEAVAKEEVSV